MSSSRRPTAGSGQSGAGLVEVLVSVVLLGIALAVMLGSVSSLLLGARAGEHRIVAQRLARNTIESDRARLSGGCNSNSPAWNPITYNNGGAYSITHPVTCQPGTDDAVVVVTVVDPDGGRFVLRDEVVTP